MMRTLLCLAGVASAVCFSPSALPLVAGPAARPARCSTPLSMQLESRRSVLASAALAAGSVVLGQTSLAAPASAKLDPRLPTPDDLTIYVGAGCFWHVQHEIVNAEQMYLNRTDAEITALAGYAGGTRTGFDKHGDPMVCYHNNDNIADYGSLGHAEVVDLSIPEDSLADFTRTYLSLMDKDGNRPDMGDRGTEFRSLIGIPGGVDSPLFE